MPEEKPSILARAAALVLPFLERKAAPALAYRHSSWGSSGSYLGNGSASFVIGTLPGDDRDAAADAGDVWLNSAVASCMGWLTDQFSEPFLEVLSLDRSTGDYAAHPTHELIDLLESPNDGYTADALWAATLLSWQMNDDGAYWIKSRAKSGKVLAVWFVPTCEMEMVWPDDGSAFLSGYRHRVDGVAYDLPREDVVHFRRGLNPANLRSGIAPLGTVVREVATDNSANAYEAAILRNMGIIPTHVQPAEAGDEFGPGEGEILKSQFQGGTTGSNRGRVVVTNARVDIKQYGLSPKDMSLGSIRFIPEDRICAVTGVNAMVVGLSSGSAHKTYNNLAEATRAAYNRALIPMQRSFARTLTRQLLWADFGGRPGVDYCEWNYDEVAALSEDAGARVDRAVKLFEARVVKRGEACEIAGVNPPDPDYDVYLEQPAAESARAWAAVDDNPATDPNAFGKPGGPPGNLTSKPVGDAGAADGNAAADGPVAPGALRIAKALAMVDAGKAGTNGHANGHAVGASLHDAPDAHEPRHATPEREDGADPFPRIAGQVASLAGLKAIPPVPPPPDPPPDANLPPDPPTGWAEDGEDPAPDEANTYNLPSGRPIADKLREFFRQQLKDLLGTVRTIGADMGDPATWTALPLIPTGLEGFDAPMTRAMTPLIGAYWDESGKRTWARLGLDPDDWRVVDPHTRAMIEGAALAFSKSTNETTTKELRQALDTLRVELAEGIVDRGESLPQLTKRVQGVFETASKSRAKTIAETEASRAVHQAQLESARQSGVVWGKKLLLSSDACALCHAVLASMPEHGWPLADAMHDDGKGHPQYSVAPCPPLHPRCRCALLLVSYYDIGLTPPDALPIFPEDHPAIEPATEPEPGAVAPPGPPGPLGRPVGDALTLPGGDMGKRLKTTLDAIARVHGDGELPVIPVVKNAASKANGSYERTQGGEAVRITISSKGKRPEETLAHEIGHFLEKTAIPGHVRGYRQWKTDPLFAAWNAAINGSAATKNMRDMAGEITVDRVTSDGRAVRYKVDGRYLAYGLTPEELWARSYSQYVATRSGDPALIAGIDAQRDPDRLYRDFHWSDEDFQPIAAAIDGMFKTLGWVG